MDELSERINVFTKYPGQALRVMLVREQPKVKNKKPELVCQAELVIEAGTRVTIGLNGIQNEHL